MFGPKKWREKQNLRKPSRIVRLKLKKRVLILKLKSSMHKLKSKEPKVQQKQFVLKMAV